GPEVCERGDERAGADARHDSEYRTCSACGPTRKDAGGERAIVAATRNRQKIYRRHRIDRAPLAFEGRPLARQILRRDLYERREVTIEPESAVGNTRHARLFCQGL